MSGSWWIPGFQGDSSRSRGRGMAYVTTVPATGLKTRLLTGLLTGLGTGLGTGLVIGLVIGVGSLPAIPLSLALPSLSSAITPAQISRILDELRSRLERVEQTARSGGIGGRDGTQGERADLLARVTEVRNLIQAAASGLELLDPVNNAAALEDKFGRAKTAESKLRAAEAITERIRQQSQGVAITGRLLAESRRLTAQAREAMAHLPRARSQTRFKIAMDAINSGRAILNSGDIVGARNSIQRGNQLFREIIKSRQIYQDLDSRLGQLKGQVQRLGPSDGSPDTSRMLERVRNALDTENFDVAKTLLRQAERDLGETRRALSTKRLARARVRDVPDQIPAEIANGRGGASSTPTSESYRNLPAKDSNPLPPSTPGGVEARIERSRRSVTSSRHLLASRVLDEAQEMVRRARQREDEGDLAGAKAQTELANRLALRAAQMLDQGK